MVMYCTPRSGGCFSVNICQSVRFCGAWVCRATPSRNGLVRQTASLPGIREPKELCSKRRDRNPCAPDPFRHVNGRLKTLSVWSTYP